MNTIKKKYYFVIFLLLIDVTILMGSTLINEQTMNRHKINYAKEHNKLLELSASNETLSSELEDARTEVDEYSY